MSDSPIPTAPDSADETNSQFQQRTSLTVGELREQHGAHFAPGFQDSDKVGQVLANAGVNTVEELLQQSGKR